MKEFTPEKNNVLPSLAKILLAKPDTLVEIKSSVGWCKIPKSHTEFTVPQTYRIRYPYEK